MSPKCRFIVFALIAAGMHFGVIKIAGLPLGCVLLIVPCFIFFLTAVLIYISKDYNWRVLFEMPFCCAIVAAFAIVLVVGGSFGIPALLITLGAATLSAGISGYAFGQL
ncbi:MAG: hypothetical protein P4L53_23400 [Candidatus Obscuribacterales bacterium]|nr:hypothetical protein [Candidatus Obscuribacterales bacterium]